MHAIAGGTGSEGQIHADQIVVIRFKYSIFIIIIIGIIIVIAIIVDILIEQVPIGSHPPTDLIGSHSH
jgi:hypothetical protein